MRSILQGTWPPLKPLPVFRYETPHYRAKIDFDRTRGEWVCRKTSLPSNSVQEWRGELREITLALPHTEAETLIEDGEQREQESDKDTNRRLQAIREWRETCQNGARYFELRNYLSENQRRETDDILRLSLTARQLQFNSKNIAYVFDSLSTAGGRFATLIDFARQARRETVPQAQAEGTPPDESLLLDQEVPDRCAAAVEPPAISIRDVLPEQYQFRLAEQGTHGGVVQSEIDTCEIADSDSDSATLDQIPLPEQRSDSPFTDVVPHLQVDSTAPHRPADSSHRSTVLEISALHLAAFTSLVLFALLALVVGLTVGRGPLGSRLREFSESVLHLETKPQARPQQASETSPHVPAPAAVVSSDKTARSAGLDNPAPSEESSSESASFSPASADARPTDSNQSSTMESAPTASSAQLPETAAAVNSSPGVPITRGFIAPQPAMRHPHRSSTILVDVPVHGSQPARVSFPERPIAATSSVAVSSQLSVIVPAERGPAALRKPARVQAGELISFVSPRYPRLRDGYARVIRVRATIGPAGQVQGVKFLSGSTSLLPATVRAIRRWHYMPTLLDKKPLEAHQDITIEFRPSQSPRRNATPHPGQKLVAVK